MDGFMRSFRETFYQEDGGSRLLFFGHWLPVSRVRGFTSQMTTVHISTDVKSSSGVLCRLFSFLWSRATCRLSAAPCNSQRAVAYPFLLFRFLVVFPRWICRWWSSGLRRLVNLYVDTSVSEEHTASICCPEVEVVCFSETLVSTCSCTRHHNPQCAVHKSGMYPQLPGSPVDVCF
jgi:hypothetical protein